MGFKHSIKKGLYAGLYYSGVEWLITRLMPVDAAVILMFHGVAEQVSMPASVNFHTTSRVLDAQVRMLMRRYEVIGMGELLDRLTRGERLNKQVVLTFDDGYRNNLTLVAPILRRHGAPFSIYLATSRIGSPRFLPLNEIYMHFARGKLSHEDTMALRKKVRTSPMAATRESIDELSSRATEQDRAAVAESFAMLSWDEVRELSRQPGVEIGAHTDSHCNMAAEPPDSQRRELELCRGAIEENTGQAPRLFAYPFGGSGYHDATTRQNVIDAGFDCAITTQKGLVRRGTDPYTLPRVGNFASAWFLAGELLYLFLRERFGR
jgi:peptidoglycan/xylan/chitin deacetylase (PgdA/CDA1 family)